MRSDDTKVRVLIDPNNPITVEQFIKQCQRKDHPEWRMPITKRKGNA